MIDPAHHHQLCVKGFNPDLATKSLNAQLNLQAILALIAKYGLPVAEQIISDLLAGNA